MLQGIVIGYLGGDAESQVSNGREFTTFRVAHTNKWSDESGATHEETTWVDCIISGESKVTQYLKKGTQVFAQGSVSLRVYSSKKDRCMKAGLTINVRQIELLGSKPDDVPSRLYNVETNEQVDVTKHFYARTLERDENTPEKLPLVSRSNEKFYADRSGWVYRDTTTEE